MANGEDGIIVGIIRRWRSGVISEKEAIGELGEYLSSEVYPDSALTTEGAKIIEDRVTAIMTDWEGILKRNPLDLDWGEGMTWQDRIGGIGRPQSLEEYGATATGQRDIMSADLARQLGPTPTPFLQAAGERMFDPIRAGYTLGAGLGQLPGQMAPGTEWSPQAVTGIEPAPTFTKYLANQMGVLPSQQQLQSQVAQAAALFGADQEDLGSAQRGFQRELTEDMGRQYNLALSSVLQNMPIHLRGPFSRWAEDKYREFRGTSPDKQFLPHFVGRGFSFG